MASLVTAHGRMLVATGGWIERSLDVALASTDYVPSEVGIDGLEMRGVGRCPLTGCRLETVDGRLDLVAENATFAGLQSTESYRWACVLDGLALVLAVDMHPGGFDLSPYASHTIAWDGGERFGRVMSVGECRG